MKIKTISIITLSVFVICAAVGITVKQNCRKFDWNNVVVGVFWEDMLNDEVIKMYEEELPKSKNILCVRVLDDFKEGSYCSTQEVEIIKTFKSDNLKVGDKIKITPEVSSTVNGDTSDFDDEYGEDNKYDTFFYPYSRDSEYNVNMYFVNRMTVGENYLIFTDDEIAKGSGIYSLPNEDILIAPFFAYKNKNNTPAGIDAEYEYNESFGHSVKYEQLKNNEFFGDTQKCIDNFNKLKKYLIEKYPE